MKRISSIILSLVLILNTLPLSAQEVLDPVISKADLESYNDIRATTNKELNRIEIDNPEAVHKEFLDILKWKSTQAFKDLKDDPGKTYVQKQTRWNMALLPIIETEECYINENDPRWKKETPKCKKSNVKGAPKSKYFQEPYQLYMYALDVFYENTIDPEAQQIGLKDYHDMARRHIREIIQKRSQEKNFFADLKIDNTRNPYTESGYLVAYASQINSFYTTVREAKLAKSKCKDSNLADFWGYSKEECELINLLADNYDLNTINMGRQRIGTFAAIAAEEVDYCLRDVLYDLQTPYIPFEEVEDFLESKSRTNWKSCGMSKDQLIQIIVDNSLTREEAKQYLKKGFGGKILQGLDYISFSYWMDRMDKKQTFESYVINTFGEDKLEELKEEGNRKEEREIAELMAESYNAVISAFATDLIRYGKIFYYHDDSNLVGIEMDEDIATNHIESRAVNASEQFAKTWAKMANNQINAASPIAKFARGAILQAGGKARNFENQLFTKTMFEVKGQENVKTNIMVFSIGMDFVLDPLMVLGPLKMVKGTKLLKTGAKYAPKTTRAVYNTTKEVKVAVQTAKVAVKESKVGQTASRVGKTIDKVNEPLKKLGKNIIHEDWDDFGKYAARGTDPSKGVERVTTKVDDAANVVKKADNIAEAAPIAKTTPEPKTALDPKKANPAKEFDELVARANPSDQRTVVAGFGGKSGTNVSPTSTTSGAPEGMRRQIGFGNEGKYIPDDTGKAVSGKGGVQDFTRGTPQGSAPRGPEGFRQPEVQGASRNPYDVRNSAAGTTDAPNAPSTTQQTRPAVKPRNEWTKPETTIQQTLDVFDDEIAKLEAQRKKLGIFSSRNKKIELDYQIKALKEQRAKFFNSVDGKFSTRSPIYDNFVEPRKAEVESYLSTTRINGNAASTARNKYVKLYNRYLSINVDALPPAQRAEFVKNFDELSGLRFTDAVSTGPERIAYQNRIDALTGFLDNMDSGAYHIKFGGYNLGQAKGGSHSGLREVHLGANNATNSSSSLGSLKAQIDHVPGPNGFKEPPLVDVSAHGYLYGTPQNGASWHGTFGSGGDNTVAEIVNTFGDGQQYNIYLRNCHGGAAMDDFLAIPAKKRGNINMFTEAGRNQSNFSTVSGHIPGTANNSVGAAIDNMTASLNRGNIGSRAVINGQHYYPLEEAINQARREGNVVIAQKLDTYKTLLDASDPAEFQRAATQYSRLFPGTPAPTQNIAGFTITKSQGSVIPGKVLYVDPESTSYVTQVGKDMLSPLRGKSKAAVPMKLNPATITVP